MQKLRSGDPEVLGPDGRLDLSEQGAFLLWPSSQGKASMTKYRLGVEHDQRVTGQSAGPRVRSSLMRCSLPRASGYRRGSWRDSRAAGATMPPSGMARMTAAR